MFCSFIFSDLVKTESPLNFVNGGLKKSFCWRSELHTAATLTFCITRNAPLVANKNQIITSKQQVMVFCSPLLLLLFQVQFNPSQKGLNSEQERPLDVIFILSFFFRNTAPSLSVFQWFVPPPQQGVISSRWRSWSPPRLGTHSGWRGEHPTWRWPTSPPPRRSGSPRSRLSPGGEEEEKGRGDMLKKMNIRIKFIKS